MDSKFIGCYGEVDRVVTLDYEVSLPYYPVNVIPYIEVVQEIALTKKEIIYMQSLTPVEKDKREAKIARLHFAMNYTMQEVADVLQLSKTQIFREVEQIRRKIKRNIRKDLRENKRVMNYLVDVLEANRVRQREIWKMYANLQADSIGIRRIIEDANNRRRENRGIFDRRTLQELSGAAKSLVMITDSLRELMKESRMEESHMVQTLDRFGLTGNDAMELIVSGGIDVDVRVQELRTMVFKVLDIVKDEVKDESQKKTVFGRLAREIKTDGYSENSNRAERSECSSEELNV